VGRKEGGVSDTVAQFGDPHKAHNDRIKSLEADLRAAIDERDRALAEATSLRRLASFYRSAALCGETLTKSDAEYRAELDTADGDS
jgi:hypothetical protein